MNKGKIVRILVTGGLGYIGSHATLALHNDGHEVLVVDNLANASETVISALEKIAGKQTNFCQVDICNQIEITKVFMTFRPEVVLHLAGFKDVKESHSDPLKYFQNNVSGSVSILRAMDGCKCKKIVFSSSATVYGPPSYLPIDEVHPVGPINPYGRTKLFVEQIIQDWQRAAKERSAICLRYFNPVGVHESGFLGEMSINRPTNLFPLISGVAAGRYRKLSIFGDDYRTRDGTGERDFIHVMDLVEAHSRAINILDDGIRFEIVNLGTGNGTTVKELINYFEVESGRAVICSYNKRRLGDVESCYADVSKAARLLNWKTKRSIGDACRHQWNWEIGRPR